MERSLLACGALPQQQCKYTLFQQQKRLSAHALRANLCHRRLLSQQTNTPVIVNATAINSQVGQTSAQASIRSALPQARAHPWSPIDTFADSTALHSVSLLQLCLSLRSMLASNTDYNRPPGDTEYCSRVGGRSPKLTKWAFDDDRV